MWQPGCFHCFQDLWKVGHVLEVSSLILQTLSSSRGSVFLLTRPALKLLPRSLSHSVFSSSPATTTLCCLQFPFTAMKVELLRSGNTV